MNNSKLNMYCISIDQSDLKLIQKLNYFPVGLGEENFTAEWHRDNTGKNISYKNNRIYSIKWQHRKNHIMIMDLLSILF